MSFEQIRKIAECKDLAKLIILRDDAVKCKDYFAAKIYNLRIAELTL